MGGIVDIEREIDEFAKYFCEKRWRVPPPSPLDHPGIASAPQARQRLSRPQLRSVCGRLRKCKLFLRLVRAHTVRCCRVSGLVDCGISRRGPVWRYAGRVQNRPCVLDGTWSETGFPDPGLVDRLPLPSSDLLAFPTTTYRLLQPSQACVDASANASFFFGWFGHIRSGAVVCPASLIAASPAAGLYGDTRVESKIGPVCSTAPGAKLVFPTRVSLTVCPYHPPTCSHSRRRRIGSSSRLRR